MKTKYNYVFFNINEDYLQPGYMPLNNYSFVETYKHAFNSNKIINKLFFYHWSAKLNSKINLPFKSIWFSKMFKKDFGNDKPVCYVFSGAKYIRESPFVYKYIKGLNPNNKIVISFGDLISKRNFDIDYLKNNSDYITTYDKGEADKYGITFYDDLSYGAIIDVDEPEEFENDVYFLGFAKDRLNEIHSVYNSLEKEGLKCKFIVCGTSPSDQIKAKGIFYQKPISYIENLENVKKSKCVLELIQGGSVAPTLRVKEAQTYKRKLLSNNIYLEKQDYFDNENMRVFENSDDIDISFLKTKIDYASFNLHPFFKPENRIEFLENLLNGG